MTIYVLCAQRDSSGRWVLDGMTPSMSDAELTHRQTAEKRPSSVSVVEIDDTDDYFTPVYRACGFDENDTVPEPPGDVILRSDK
jgi:hypothetical protein